MHKINIIPSFIIKSRHRKDTKTHWPPCHGSSCQEVSPHCPTVGSDWGLQNRNLYQKWTHTEFSTSMQMLPEAANFHLPIFQLPTQTQSRLQPQQYLQPLKQTSQAPRALGCPLQAQVKLAFSTMPEAKVWTLKQVLISLIINQPVSENAENAQVTHYMIDIHHHIRKL